MRRTNRDYGVNLSHGFKCGVEDTGLFMKWF